MSKSLIAALSALLLLAQSTPPQSPPPAQPQPQQQPKRPPVFRSGTSQVRVAVVVLAQRCEQLSNLTKADFELLEDGQPQSIDTVKLVEANGRALDDRADDMSLEIRSTSHALAEAARDDVRVFVIFWDEYHIGQMAPSI